MESDVNFVDAGVPPADVRGDARFARWLRRRGGRREDLVVGGHLSRGAFAPRESDDEAERTASAVDLKRGSVWFPRSAVISVILNEARAYTLHACLWGSVEATCALSWMFVKCTPLKAHLQCTLFCQMQ